MLRRCRIRRQLAFGGIGLGDSSESHLGRQLDIYARRDAQLAPYLLRTVDIEYHRKCTKVKFVFWVSCFTALMCLNMRTELEVMAVTMPYVQLLHELKDAEDLDFEIRQGIAASVLPTLSAAIKDPTLYTKGAKAQVSEKLAKLA